jgi:hypothetical protein
VERGGVVDAIPHVPHDVARLFERKDDALLLVRLDFGEDIHVDHLMEQRAIAQLVEIRPAEDFCIDNPICWLTLAATEAIVSGDDLQ